MFTGPVIERVRYAQQYAGLRSVLVNEVWVILVVDSEIRPKVSREGHLGFLS